MNEQAYDELVTRAREAWLLGTCSALLSWDEHTYMPKGGVEHRGRQLALLAGLAHERATDPRLGELLTRLETSPASDPLEPRRVNVRELRRRFDRATRLPRKLVEELARTTSRAQQEWIVARKERRFELFEPWLSKVVALKRDEAQAHQPSTCLYDALLEDYEPGARVDQIKPLFDELRRELVDLVHKVDGAPRRPTRDVLEGEFPLEKQRALGERASRTIGFDFDRGRLDTTAHPFCTGIGPGDTRLTTRYQPRSFTESFFGVLHETGHGLYEQGLDPEEAGLPMGEAVSLGIHESQSRLWENAVGRGLPFWRHFFPIACQMFPSLKDVRLDDFHTAVNRVSPSLIRVEADEVTYNLHVMVRFELEQELLEGKLDAADTPSAWNDKYRQYLGLVPSHDSEGCLQDIHWSAGLFGYFPTYTLGNVYGAQLFAHARSTLGDLEASFVQGDYSPLLDWLRANVHRQGQRYGSTDLIQFATQEKPSARALVSDLRRQVSQVYGV